MGALISGFWGVVFGCVCVCGVGEGGADLDDARVLGVPRQAGCHDEGAGEGGQAHEDLSQVLELLLQGGLAHLWGVGGFGGGACEMVDAWLTGSSVFFFHIPILDVRTGRLTDRQTGKEKEDEKQHQHKHNKPFLLPCPTLPDLYSKHARTCVSAIAAEIPNPTLSLF